MKEAKIAEILAPVGPEETRQRESRVREHFWRTLKRAARQIPFFHELAAAYFAALDKRTPGRVRGTMLAALAYFVLPFDLIPDFLAVFGFTDDLAVLTAAMAAIRPHIKDGHRDAAVAALEE